MNLSDQQINKLLKRNPQKAIKYLFELYYDDLYRFAHSLVETKEVSEELVQEVFIYLWEKRDTLNFSSSAKSYLFRAVKNRSINYFKSKYASYQFQEINDTLEINNLQEGAHSFDELKELTKKAIDSLPERCALIFKMSRNFGMTYKEISENLNISIKTVENQMTIALKRIRAALDFYWFEKE